jgi:PST family polysaccharide transporter
MLMLLAAISFVRPTADTIGSYLQIRHRERMVAIRDLSTVAFIMAGLWSFGRWGPNWACVAVGLAFAARLLISAVMLRALEGTPLTAVLGPILRPVLACIPMVGAVAAVHLWVSPRLRPPVALGAEVVAGGVAYALGALAIAREQAQDLLVVMREFLGRRA